MLEDEQNALRQLLVALQRGELPEMPIPGDKRYAMLPEWKRNWIERASEEKLLAVDAVVKVLDTDRLAKLCQIIDDYNAAKTIGKAGKWLALLVLGFFGTSFAAAKGGIEVFGWFREFFK